MKRETGSGARYSDFAEEAIAEWVDLIQDRLQPLEAWLEAQAEFERLRQVVLQDEANGDAAGTTSLAKQLPAEVAESAHSYYS